MLKLKIIIIILFAWHFSYAQEFSYTHYNTSNGLPSNFITNCAEDGKGFLWIASDAGVIRFDGKNFTKYDTQKGLPDTDILDIATDIDGKVWLNIYKKQPCYYDEATDSFILYNKIPENSINPAIASTFNKTSNGLIAFNGYGSYLLSNKLSIGLKGGKNTSIQSNATIYISKTEQWTLSQNSLLKWVNQQITDSLKIIEKNLISRNIVDGTDVFMLDPISNTISRVSNISFSKKNFTVIRKTIPEAIRKITVSDNYLWALSNTGNIYALDKTTLEIKRKSNLAVANNIYVDRKKNTWVSTIDKGLIKIAEPQVKQVPLPDNFTNRNFLSICKWNHFIYAGNYNGDIISSNLIEFNSYQFKSSNNPWIRHLLPTKSKLVASSDGAAFSPRLLKNNQDIKMVLAKQTHLLSEDSILAVNYLQMQLINTIDSTTIALIQERINAITSVNNHIVYYGNNSGVYKANLHDNKTSIRKIYAQNIISLFFTQDSLVFAGTATDGLFVFYKDSLVQIINSKNYLPGNSIRSIHAEKKGTVWVGTNAGLAAIDYTNSGNLFNYKIRNIGTTEGLLSPLVNAVWVENDTVYAATSNGLNYISSSFNPEKNNYTVYVTNIIVNGVGINLRTKIILSHHQNSIRIFFSTPAVHNSAITFRYQLNNGNWQNNTTGVLDLPQLDPGKYTIALKTIDANGIISEEATTLEFEIKKPWWRSIWMLALYFALLVSGTSFMLQKINQRRAQKKLDRVIAQQRLTDLELQALRSQINPHFIFNCLNSIKSLIYQNQYEEADAYLDDFSFLLRATIDHGVKKYISLGEEIVYIEHYLRLEKLRFGKRLEYTISSGAIEKNRILIPSMLLQPYVENAIKHGIRHLVAKTGHINITFEQLPLYLSCIIEDNGIGRTASKKINESNPAYHQSVGLSLTQKRESIFSVDCRIIDKMSDDAIAAGTMIILHIPLKDSNNIDG